MATRTLAQIPDISTDVTNVDIQNCATFVENVLVTDGTWTRETATGETAPGSLTRPTAANTKQGFRVYAMADSLQATRPVFMRVDYGSGAAAAQFGIWLTIGTTHDGAGGIGGNGILTPIQVQGNTSNNATSTTSYGSADKNRVSITMFINITGGTNIGQYSWGVERTKDSNGLDTIDGLIVMTAQGAGGLLLNKSQIVDLANSTQPPVDTGLSIVLAAQNPSTFSSNVGVSLVIPFKGNAQQPGTNWAVVRSGDFSNGAQFALTVYGSSRTYQHLGNVATISLNLGTAGTSGNLERLCMRFD